MENNDNDSINFDENEKIKLKNDKKNSLVKSFSMLVLISFCLISSIYSFFYEEEDNINIKVGVSNGIQISVDAMTWKTSINNNDIANYAYVGNSNQIPNNMNSVSSAGDIDVSTGFMKMFNSLLEIDSNVENGYRVESKRSVESSGNTGDFIAFDLFILSNEDTAVYLNNSSDVISDDNSCAKSAHRVAFLYQGVSHDANDAINLKGAQSYSEEDQLSNIIWQPNSEDEKSYYAINQDIDGEQSVDYMSNGDEFTLITPNIQTPKLNEENGNSKTLFNLKEGINKIRIYAWIEVQDNNCDVNISTSDILYNIQISKNAEN